MAPERLWMSFLRSWASHFLKNALSHWCAEDTPHADVFYCWSRTHWRLGFDPCNASCGKRSWVALVFEFRDLLRAGTCPLRAASLCKWIPKYTQHLTCCVPSPIPWSAISTWPGYLLGSTWPVQGFLACTHWMALCSAQISAVFCGVSQSCVPWYLDLGAFFVRFFWWIQQTQKTGGKRKGRSEILNSFQPDLIKLSFQLLSSN